jgi:diketogulonate reductase-like aldo/keto reductase
LNAFNGFIDHRDEPDHMKSNAEIDFEISDDDMATLNAVVHEDYGDAAMMPVFGGTLGD